MKQERLDWLADSRLYTKRFAFHIRRRCRNSSIRDVAKEPLLDWKTVKALEMQYMREQIKRAGHPRPRVFGVDEISIRTGQPWGKDYSGHRSVLSNRSFVRPNVVLAVSR